jgi:putative salt-induced outer membrane protein YdiY
VTEQVPTDSFHHWRIVVPGRCARLLRVAVVVAIGTARAPVALGQAPAPAAAPPGPPPRLEASAQFTFLSTTGNASVRALGAGGDITRREDRWTYNGKFIFAQNETDDELTARSVAGLFRVSRTLTPRLAGYGQYDFLRDLFAGIEQRHVIEGGLSYLAVDRGRHRLRLDGGLGYLYEREPDGHFDSASGSLGALYRLAMTATSELTFEPRYILTFADTGAWKYDQAAALNVALNTILSLKLSHTIRYAAEPPEGFETTDTITAVSIVARIRRER